MAKSRSGRHALRGSQCSSSRRWWALPGSVLMAALPRVVTHAHCAQKSSIPRQHWNVAGDRDKLQGQAHRLSFSCSRRSHSHSGPEVCREGLQETKPRNGELGELHSALRVVTRADLGPGDAGASVAELVGMVTGLAGPFALPRPLPPPSLPLPPSSPEMSAGVVADLGSVCQVTLTPSHLSVQFSHKCWRH